jgi:hypothetical protein
MVRQPLFMGNADTPAVDTGQAPHRHRERCDQSASFIRRKTMAIPGSSNLAWSAASDFWFWSMPSTIIRSRLVTVSKKLTLSPSIGSAVALASERIVATSWRSALVSVRMDCARVDGVVGVGVGTVVMVGPFEQSGEFGAAHTGEAMRCTKEYVSGCGAHDPGARLVARHKQKPMPGEAGTEGVAGFALGPRLPYRILHLGKVDTPALRRLMYCGGERFGGN